MLLSALGRTAALAAVRRPVADTRKALIKSKRAAKRKRGLDRRRLRVGLAPQAVLKNRVSATTANTATIGGGHGFTTAFRQFQAIAGGKFNACIPLDGIYYSGGQFTGFDTTNMNGARVRILPRTLRLDLLQVANSETQYRIMVVQMMEEFPNCNAGGSNVMNTDLDMSTMLVNYSTAEECLNSVFRPGEDRDSGNFRVLYDKLRIVNTYQNRNTLRRYKIKQGAHTVRFDGADNATTAQFATFLLILIDGAAVSANYTFRFNCVCDYYGT